jgi:hypothetical protein
VLGLARIAARVSAVSAVSARARAPCESARALESRQVDDELTRECSARSDARSRACSMLHGRRQTESCNHPMKRSHWTPAGSVSPRTTAHIMGSPTIDEVLDRSVLPRDRGGTDLPSVIARIGRKLAHLEDDHRMGTPAGVFDPCTPTSRRT